MEEEIIGKRSLENNNRGNIKIKDLFHKYGLKNEEIHLIKDLIRGKSAGSTPPNIHYLYQVGFDFFFL